ncbi:hypothetical protein, partial [Streptomyces wuyuanensis]|uniref:hypothetical protein n=1 Tax=Streptomyces wuyuanensis TaxID=1196353 RepID=UPI00342265A4
MNTRTPMGLPRARRARVLLASIAGVVAVTGQLLVAAPATHAADPEPRGDHRPQSADSRPSDDRREEQAEDKDEDRGQEQGGNREEEQGREQSGNR